jgi:hypothetical protein
MKIRLLTVAALLALTSTACVSGKKAFPIASQRSGCASDKIEVVKQEGSEVTLNVCGTYEDWRWNALNGWEYVRAAGNQPLATPMDSDGDGVPDDADACVAVAGQSALDPKLNGCPPPEDTDRDGVPDAVDACANQIGVAQDDPKTNGCPPDADKDGIADNLDRCPDTAGVANADANINGCPPDQDGDGVADAQDGCPAKAGVANADAKLNGCPPDKDGDGIVDGDDKCPDEAGVANTDDAEKHGCPAAEKKE